MTSFDVWHPRAVRTPADLDALTARLKSLSADGITLQWTAPAEGGTVRDLWAGDTQALARAVLRLHGAGLRVGVMEWAGADAHLVRAHLARLDALLSALGSDVGALAFVELDAEEEWTDDGAEEVRRGADLLEAGWSDLGEACPEITLTTLPSLPLKTHALIQLQRIKRWRPQCYNFRKAGDPAHWSHQLAAPRQQMVAWRRGIEGVLEKGWVSEVEVGLACYWQSGLSDAGQPLSVRAALDLSLELAEGFPASNGWVGYWSLPWISGVTEAWWKDEAAKDEAAKDTDGQGELLPPLIFEEPPMEAGAGDNQIRTLQRQLTKWGYLVGGVDGKVGPRTRAAAEAYRTDADRVRGTLETL